MPKPCIHNNPPVKFKRYNHGSAIGSRAVLHRQSRQVWKEATAAVTAGDAMQLTVLPP